MLQTIERLNNNLAARNPEQEIEMGLFRFAIPEFDKRAIREALVNAFSHRDYSKMGRVRVTIGDEGLTIADPGGFIEGVSISNLLTTEPHGRNPQLADALKRIGLAERTGRGIDRIYEGSLIFGRPLPDYSASTSVTVSLFIQRRKPDRQIAQLVANERNRLGRPLSLDILRGCEPLKVKDISLLQAESFGKLKILGREDLELIIGWLIEKRCILETKERYPVLHPAYSGIHYNETMNKSLLMELKKRLEENAQHQ